MSYLQLFSNQLIQLKTIDSTSNYIAKLSKEVELTEGVVVMTSCQTSGRGQKGSGWYSEPHKNLLFSILLKPSFLNINYQFYLSMVICLSLKHTLEKFEIENISIKWPNDILVNNRKICGVLIENTLNNSQISQSVVGIGLNVNEEIISNPMLKAISMYDVLNKEFDLINIIKVFKVELTKWYFILQQKKYSFIKQQYLTDLLFFNQFKQYSYVKNNFWITDFLEVVDVEDSGLLVLVNKKKQLIKVALKEIKFKY